MKWAMGDNDTSVEQLDPHEAYGVRRVQKSRAESLQETQAELNREMARRAGTYGRRLVELFEALGEAQQIFEAGLEALTQTALRRFGHQATRWSWHEFVAQTEALPPERGAPAAARVRAVELSAERHEALRVEADTARHYLIIHREAMGFRQHHLVEEKFPLPAALPPLEVAWSLAHVKPKIK